MSKKRLIIVIGLTLWVLVFVLLGARGNNTYVEPKTEKPTAPAVKQEPHKGTGVILFYNKEKSEGEYRQEFLDLVNQTRNDLAYKKGLQTEAGLKLNEQLTLACKDRIKDMEDKQYFYHFDPDGKSWVDAVEKRGYEGISGENISIIYTEEKPTAGTCVAGYIESPGHQENMINPIWRDTGIVTKKITMNGQTAWLNCQIFGTQEKEKKSYPQQVIEIGKTTMKTNNLGLVFLFYSGLLLVVICLLYVIYQILVFIFGIIKRRLYEKSKKTK
jgi:uncharacterized protein YkwD